MLRQLLLPTVESGERLEHLSTTSTDQWRNNKTGRRTFGEQRLLHKMLTMPEGLPIVFGAQGAHGEPAWGRFDPVAGIRERRHLEMQPSES